MDDDRTLLELAANAAGIELWHEDVFTNGLTRRISSNGVRRWNPLTDIGDAARLLLLLKLRVDYVGDQPCIDGVLQHGMTAEESFCRAIVRAAAAMAQTTKEQT